MPGPRNKPKKKPAPKVQIDIGSLTLGSRTEDAELVASIEANAGWWRIVDLLCAKYDIPDLTKKAGFRKVNASFDTYYGRLESCYNIHEESPVIQAGVVAVFSRLAADSVIRNKLFNRGFLEKVWPLLEIPECSRLAFRCLKVTTRHGGAPARIETAKKSPLLLKALRDHSNDAVLVGIGVSILTHCAIALFESGKPSTSIIQTLDIPGILALIVEIAKAPSTTFETFSHGIHFVSIVAQHSKEAIVAFTPALRLLVGCLRSPLISTRTTAMCGLLRITRTGSTTIGRETVDPQRLVRFIRANSTPPDCVDALMDFGLLETEAYTVMQTLSALTKEMMELPQRPEKDYYGLGKKLGTFILTTEFSLPLGFYGDENGRPHSIIGLPFTNWVDVAPICAKAIRNKGKPEEQYIAEMLELKHQIISPDREASAVVGKAEAAAAKYRNRGYFFYARALMTIGAEVILPWAKKGLRCSTNTPWLESALLERAVFAAVDLTQVYLQEADSEESLYELGSAFMKSALEDSERFMKIAPPDNRHMKAVIMWYLIMTITHQGTGLSQDLRELQPAFEKLKIVDKLSQLYFGPLPQTQGRRCFNIIREHYQEAAAEWDSVLKNYDGKDGDFKRGIAPPDPQAEDKINDWLEREEEGGEKHQQEYILRKTEVVTDVHLYRCTWCSNPSASLKKCSQCGQPRYCDTTCQKAHWEDGHKKMCKKLAKTHPGS